MNPEIAPNFSQYKRNEFGLLDNVSYVLNQDGSVNWRAMIPEEFIYVNKEWFSQRGKEIPSSISGLDDKQLLILLGGIKALAKLRGFSSRSFSLGGNEKYVTAKCQINWIGNYETSMEPILFEDVANASVDNTDSFCHKFLETIAANRAFVRCVRNFLNIHIVGDDEIDKSENNSDPSQQNFSNPSALLEKIAQERGMPSFEEFQNWLRELWRKGSYQNREAGNWKSFADVPPKESRSLIMLLKS